VALRKTFDALCVQLDEMFRATDELQRAARDKPAQGDLALVRIFGEAADTLQGWLAEALEAAGAAAAAAEPPADLDRARVALAAANERVFRVVDGLADLVSYERIDELAGAGRELGGAWLDWAVGVRYALEQCREQLDLVAESFFACWQELAERATAGGVSVRATAIGQQLSTETLAAANRNPGGEDS
jgi:hypothetical protein